MSDDSTESGPEEQANELIVFDCDGDGDELPTIRHPIAEHVADTAADQYKYGEVIPGSWLQQQFGVTLNTDEPMTRAEMKRRELQFMQHLILFRARMLKVYRMDCKPVGGQEGYEAKSQLILQPAQQAEDAIERLRKQATKEAIKAAERVAFIDYAALTEEQKRDAANVAGKISAFQVMQKRELRNKVRLE